ncbi:MAG: hypothetical protein WBZ42_03710 [Halobacteriota archaeon]
MKTLTNASKQKTKPTKRITYYMGVDLGQVQDHTAIVTLEHVEIEIERSDKTNEHKHEWHLLDATRLPLRTSYQDITKYIKNLIRLLEGDGGRVILVVDATGVGRPVIDLLREMGLQLVPVTITGGLSETYDDIIAGWRVPKIELVSAANIMLGKTELKIARDIPLLDTLLSEFQNFDVKVNSATGHASYEASSREGAHDDLILALSLACWFALQKKDFVNLDEVVTDTSEGAIHPEDYYRIGWVPNRDTKEGALAIYNVGHGSVISFQRLKHQTVQDQIEMVFRMAQQYEAAVWAQAGTDDAILRALMRRGAAVKRVDVTQERWTSAYENLLLLISYKQIKLPRNPGLLADIVAGQNSAVRALCLVTYNIHPEIEAKAYHQIRSDVHSWFKHGGGGEGGFYKDGKYYKKIDLDDYGDDDEYD